MLCLLPVAGLLCLFLSRETRLILVLALVAMVAVSFAVRDMRARRMVLAASVALAAFLLPLSVSTVAILIGPLNPMQAAFITEFTIENRSGETVHITPVGTVGMEGHKGLLPQFVSAFPAIPAKKESNLIVADRQSIRILYDWDDINFSEIAIRDEAGKWYQLVTDPEPTKDQYHPPHAKHYEIGKLAELPPATRDVIKAAQAWPSSAWILGFAVAGVLVPVVLIWTIIRYRRLATAAMGSPSPSGQTARHL